MSLRPAKKDAQVETNPRGRVRVATIQVDGDLSSSLARLLLSTPPNSAPGYPELPTDVKVLPILPIHQRSAPGPQGIRKPGNSSEQRGKTPHGEFRSDAELLMGLANGGGGEGDSQYDRTAGGGFDDIMRQPGCPGGGNRPSLQYELLGRPMNSQMNSQMAR